MQNEGHPDDSVLSTTNVVQAPPRWWYGRNFANVIFSSIGVMLVSTAFFTISAISNSVIHDMRKYGLHDGDGSTSLAIMSVVQLVATPVIPLAVRLLGGKGSIIAGAVLQLFYVCAFELNSMRLLMFITSGIFGFGTMIFESGQGVILTVNSSVATATKLAAVFWVIMNFSQIWGNLFVAIKFNHLNVIDDTTRRVTFSLLIGMIFVGCAVLFLIRETAGNSTTASVDGVSLNADTQATDSPTTVVASHRIAHQSSKSANLIRQCRITFRLITSPPMLLCIGCFASTGYISMLLSSPVPTAVGFDKHFGDARKQLIGVSGFCTGAAEIIGGLSLLMFSNYVSRTVVYIFGTFLGTVAMGLSALNMPQNASVEDSALPTTLFGNGSSVVICIVCAFLFGLSDCATNISLFSMMSDVFGHEQDATGQDHSQETVHSSTEESNKAKGVAAPAVLSPDLTNDIMSDITMQLQESTATAFAMFNATQAIQSCVVLFLSSYMQLSWYFWILVPLCIWSSLGFYFVERNFQAGKYQNYFRIIYQE